MFDDRKRAGQTVFEKPAVMECGVQLATTDHFREFKARHNGRRKTGRLLLNDRVILLTHHQSAA
jgi:hypothetical protein